MKISNPLFESMILLLLACPVYGEAVVNIPLKENAPALEQVAAPGHAFWYDAVRLEGMTDFFKDQMPKWNSSAYITATKDYLYLQVTAETAAGTNLKAVEVNRDGAVYLDDCIEIGIALPGAQPDEYWQFSVNSLNAVFDAYRTDKSYNSSAVTTQVTVEDTQWTASLRIPFRDLGLEQVPEALNINIARSTTSPDVEQSVLVRCSPVLFFGDLNNALQLRFGEQLPAAAVSIEPGSESPVVRMRAITLPEEKFADFRVNIYDSNNQLIGDVYGQSRFDSPQADLPLPVLPDGKYRVEVIMEQARVYQIPAYYGGGQKNNEALAEDEEAGLYLKYQWPLIIDNAPALLGKVHLQDEGKTMTAELTPRFIICSEDAVYQLQILDPAGNLIQDLGTIPYQEDAAKVTASIDTLPERSRFILRAVLVDDGDELLSVDTPFATPPKPVWKAENPDRPNGNVVPDPWTPVELNGLTGSCWNREYQFAENSPVPAQILSGGTPLLAAPGRIVSTPAIHWELKEAKQLNPSCIRYDYLGKTDDGAEVTAFSELYFDGVVRTDITIPEKAEFSHLALEIPYRKEIASFVHQGPGMFGGMFNLRTLQGAETHSYIPNFMMLNDDVGLGWFDGMKFDWNLADGSQAVVMTPEADSVLLHVNYIDHAGNYDQSRTFSCGLQSFPARPMPEKEDAMRFCYLTRYGDEDRIAWYSTVDYFANGNIDIEQGALEFKFMLPKLSGENEPLLQMAHGESYQVRIGVDPAGQLYAFAHEYYQDKYRMTSTQPVIPGVWNAVALNWDEEKVQLFLNGQKISEVAHSKLMRVVPTVISIGGMHALCDELRVSSAPRETFALDSAPRLDDQTLLLDTFDRMHYVNGRRATDPAKISADTEAGYLLPDTNLVEGVRTLAVGPMTAPLRSLLEGYAALGVDAMCYHASQYTDEAFSGLYIAEEDKFKRSVAAIHDAGMRAVLYVGNSLSNYDRSWNTYADEWLIEPRGVPFIQSWLPDEKGYQACPRSEYIDYFFYRIGKLIDDYGVDGIFLDGRMEAECSNARHGCGVVDFDGNSVPERDVWDGRYKSQFLYNVFHNRKVYGEQHKSGNWNIPGCFYWDGVWEGEQLMGVQLNGRKKLDVFPLEAMRGEINGLPFGMPSRNTAYAYAPFTPIENCTMSFVHGTTWTMTYRIEEGHVVSPYWLAQIEFGCTYHNFLPYWDKNPPAKEVCDDLIKVSAHVKPGKALIMVANFNEDQEYVEGSITLDLKNLGIEKPALINAFSKEPIAISPDGTMSIKLKSFRQEWYILSESGE